jgi:thioester reductase-like protein
MKVILTGATGFIGSHILTECLASSDITSVIILTRRALENNAAVKDNPKVTEIIHEDFSQYPPSLLEQLKGAEACIW